MPITRLPNMIGTTIDLIIRRKIVDRGFTVVPRSGLRHHTRTPRNVKHRIHFVTEILRRHLQRELTVRPVLPSWPRYRPEPRRETPRTWRHHHPRARG